MKRRTLAAASLIAATFILGGCATTVYDRGYGDSVRIAPPPPYVEYVGPPPVVGQVWISGYWNWGGARYVWVPGRWEAPRPGYNWVPHRWEREGEHWRQHGGRWEQDRHYSPRSEVREAPRNERQVERVVETRPAPNYARLDDRRDDRGNDARRQWNGDRRPEGVQRSEVREAPRVERPAEQRPTANVAPAPERRDNGRWQRDAAPRAEVQRPTVAQAPERAEPRREAQERNRSPGAEERGGNRERRDQGDKSERRHERRNNDDGR